MVNILHVLQLAANVIFEEVKKEKKFTKKKVN